MIEITMVLGESNEKRELITEAKGIVRGVRDMIELHREKEDAKVSNKLRKLFGTYEDKSGPLMSDILSCCMEIADNIAEEIYDNDLDHNRLAADIAELAHLTLQFIKETDIHWDVFAQSFNIYKQIVDILKRMVGSDE